MRDRKHDIERYLRGELSSEEMHALEKEALNDPFLAEALEGIEQAGPDNFLYDLHTIRRSVHDRLRSHPRKKNNVIRIWAWTGAIAATLLLIAVSGFIVLSLIKEQAARRQAMDAEAEQIPPEFFEKDTMVIALPAQAPVKRKMEERRPAPTLGRTSDQLPSLIAEADRPVLDQVPSGEESPIAEEADDQPPPDHLSQTEDIAKLETAEVTEIESQVSEKESASKKRADMSGYAAGVRRSAEAPGAIENGIVLRGKVVDADGEALPGVNVVVKGAKIGTATNADGQYELSVPPGYSALVFAFIGFESQEVAIDGRQEVNVALNEDVTSLSEVVVVTGYGSAYVNRAENATYRSAEPIGGRNDFKKYLETAVRYPAEAVTNKVEGRVTLRFTVEADGQLTNFEVIRGIGSGTEEALINAIKSGPKWKPGAQGDQPIADKVKVRFRFKLPE